MPPFLVSLLDSNLISSFYVKSKKGCLLEEEENSIIKPVRLRGSGEKDELSKRTGKADCKA